MKMTQRTLVLVSAILLATTCSDSGTEPPPAALEGPSSHDWTWEHTIIDPDNTTGWLWDVCYINDTCIWAVGWIKHKGENYNACRWDGKEWRLEKVPDLTPGSNTSPMTHQLYTVYGTTPDDIWFTTGTVFIHWNGHSLRTDYYLLEELLQSKGSVKTAWGNAPNNIYMAGYNGEILRYNGYFWKRLKNDIEWDIGAMHGNGDTVLVAATGPGIAGETTFYTVVGEKVAFFSQDSLPHGVQALWFSHLNDIYTDGPHSYHFDGSEWNLTMDWRTMPSGYGHDMAANSRWDILVVGAVSTIRHYNNENWKQWRRLPGLEHASFNGCTMQGDEAEKRL